MAEDRVRRIVELAVHGDKAALRQLENFWQQANQLAQNNMQLIAQQGAAMASYLEKAIKRAHGAVGIAKLASQAGVGLPGLTPGQVALKQVAARDQALAALHVASRTTLADRMLDAEIQLERQRVRREDYLQRTQGGLLARWLRGDIAHPPPSTMRRLVHYVSTFGGRLDDQGRSVGGGIPLIPRILGTSFAAELAGRAVAVTARRGSQLAAIEDSFIAQSGGAEQATERLKKLREVMGDVATDTQTMKGVVDLSVLSIKKLGTETTYTDAELAKILKNFVRLARRDGVDARKAIEDLTSGLARGEAELLNNVIKSFKPAQAMREVQEKFDLMNSDLKEMSVRQSALLMALELEAERLVRTFGESDLGDRFDRVFVVFGNFVDRLTKAITTSPQFIASLEAIGAAAERSIPAVARLVELLSSLIAFLSENSRFAGALLGGVGTLAVTKNPYMAAAGGLAGFLATNMGALESAQTREVIDAATAGLGGNERTLREAAVQRFLRSKIRLPTAFETESAVGRTTTAPGAIVQLGLETLAGRGVLFSNESISRAVATQQALGFKTALDAKLRPNALASMTAEELWSAYKEIVVDPSKKEAEALGIPLSDPKTSFAAIVAALKEQGAISSELKIPETEIKRGAQTSGEVWARAFSAAVITELRKTPLFGVSTLPIDVISLVRGE